MKIPIGLKIAALTLASTVFYMYVGQLVPQKEVYPPQETAISEEMSVEEFVETGREIMEGKGMCTTCHTIGESGALRFPDLEGIGRRAANRVEGLSDVEYLAQSLYEPEAFIVPGFNPGMPQANRPPIDLTDLEILAVIAYLQTLGGEVTVSVETDIGNLVEAGAGESVEEEPPETEMAAEVQRAPSARGADLLSVYECSACHYLDQPGRLEAPTLSNVGSRLEYQDILAALLSPEGGHGETAYYQSASPQELRRMALLLEARKGDE